MEVCSEETDASMSQSGPVEIVGEAKQVLFSC